MFDFNASSNDPYKVLGVSPNAPFSEIRKAYLAKVRSLHPDNFVGSESDKKAAEEKLKFVNRAFDTIKKNSGFKQNNLNQSTASEKKYTDENIDFIFQKAMEEVLSSKEGQEISRKIDELLATNIKKNQAK